MDVPPQPVLLPAHHQQNLAMGFQPRQPVNHMAPRFLQLKGPVNVVLLVEPRLKLHQHRHLLAVVSGPHQSGDDGGMAADPIQGLLDGQDVRILRRRPHEIHHAVEALIGVMDEPIPLPDGLEHVVVPEEIRRGRRHDGRQAQPVVQPAEPEAEGQIQRPRRLVNFGLLHLQHLGEELLELGVAVAGQLQAHRPPPLALLYRFLDFDEQILRLLVDVQIGIPGHPERCVRHNVVQLEQIPEMPGDETLQQQERPSLLRRRLHQPGQDGRHLHHRKGRFPFLAQPDAQVQALVGQHRKGPAAIHRQRRQHREQHVFEIIVRKPLLLGGQVVPLEQGDPVLPQQGQ